jgi:hypothetical protein
MWQQRHSRAMRRGADREGTSKRQGFSSRRSGALPVLNERRQRRRAMARSRVVAELRGESCGIVKRPDGSLGMARSE